MWGRKKTKLDERRELEIAAAGKQLADDVIARLDSQELEISEITMRLKKRERANNFGEALVVAMERRA